MAFLSIPNVKITGIVTCVPKKIHLVKDCAGLTSDEAEKLSIATGIRERRIADETICTSDLCFHAAERLIIDLGWNRKDIDALIFVTQTPDYILPATSPLLQQRLQLSDSCFTQDISLGCSGYVYGLATLAKLISNGDIKKGLLLVGDTISKVCSPNDKSTYPLFGDAGTATALEYGDGLITGNFKSDGSGYRSIIIPNGAFRHRITEDSQVQIKVSPGIQRSLNQLVLEGMDVFSFGITKAPQVVKELLERLSLSHNDVDHFVFHQANLLMNEKIRKKLSLPPEKVPYSLERYGNTSCATIPLTMCISLKDKLNSGPATLILCGFGVGLSWGAVHLILDGVKTIDCIEL